MKWQSIYLFIVLTITGCVGGMSPKVPDVAPMEVEAPATGNEFSIGTKAYDGLPWLIDSATGEVLVVGVQNAWYFRHTAQLQVTYVLNEPGNDLHDCVVEEIFDIYSVTLMTPKGPCVIQGDTFICPTDE